MAKEYPLPFELTRRPDPKSESGRLVEILLSEARLELQSEQKMRLARMEERGMIPNEREPLYVPSDKEIFETYCKLVDRYLIQPVKSRGLGQTEWHDEKGAGHRRNPDGTEDIENLPKDKEGKIYS